MGKKPVSRPLLAVLVVCGIAAAAIWGHTLWSSRGEGVEPDETQVILHPPKIPMMPIPPDASIVDFDWSVWDLDGREIPFETFKGKVIFVSFWATWCVPCIAEMPSIETLRKKVGSDDVAFVLVADDDARTLKRFVRDKALDLPFYRTSKIPREAYGVTGYPTTLIIDANGRVVLREGGGATWDVPEAVAFIKGLLPE